MPTDIIIRKLVIKVRTANEAEALGLRQNLGSVLQMGIMNLLDQVSRQIELPADQQVFHDRMIIELGRQKELSAEGLLHLLQAELPGRIFTLLSQPAVAAGSTGGVHAEAGRDALAALLHYLSKGYLPWWHTSGASPVQLVEEIWHDRGEGLWAALQAFYKQNTGQDLRRVAALVPRPLLLPFTGWLLQKNPQQDALLQSICSNAAPVGRFFALPAEVVITELLQLLLAPPGSYRQPGKWLVSRLLHKSPQVPNAPFDGEMDFEQAPQLIAWIQEVRRAGAGQQSPERQVKSAPNPDLEEGGAGIYVEDAGLILLHPFLSHLFSNLGLLDGNKAFVNATCQQEAVAVLHYLVYGDVAVAEWNLVLPKIICGLRPEAFVAPDLAIDDTRKAACREMLAAAAAYWDALKGASAEAMVATFVVRKGKLSWQGSHWLLQVERNAADILIDRLPWGIGVVRLPWLQHMIYTEW